jgi:hypothetical protein
MEAEQCIRAARAVSLACFDADIADYAAQIAELPTAKQVVERLYAKQRQADENLERARREREAAVLREVRDKPEITSDAARQKRNGAVEDRLLSLGAEKSARIAVMREREQREAQQQPAPKPAITVPAKQLRRSADDQATWAFERSCRVKQKRADIEAAELAENTGVPQVNPNSDALVYRARGSYVSRPAHERLYESGERQRRKQDDLEGEREQRELAEVRAPEINVHSQHLARPGDPFDRLHRSYERCAPAMRSNSEECGSCVGSVSGGRSVAAGARLHADASVRAARKSEREVAETRKAEACANGRGLSGYSRLLCDLRTDRSQEKLAKHVHPARAAERARRERSSEAARFLSSQFSDGEVGGALSEALSYTATRPAPEQTSAPFPFDPRRRQDRAEQPLTQSGDQKGPVRVQDLLQTLRSAPRVG